MSDDNIHANVEVEPSIDMLNAEAKRKAMAILEGEPVEVQQTENPDPETLQEEAPESESRTARRLLRKEKELRERSAELAANAEAKEQEFVEKQSEWEEKIKSFESASQEVKYNPVDYLKSLGIEGEDLLDVARVIFFQETPELATDEVKQKLQQMEYKKELRRLEAKFDQKTEEEPTEEEKEVVAPALVAYQESIVSFAESVDESAFPLTAKFIEEAPEGQNRGFAVAEEMYKAAIEHADSNEGKGTPLTPEQCMEKVESILKNLQLNEEAKQTSVAESEEKPAPLRNNLTKTVDDVDDSNLSYEELRAKAQKRFKAKLREKDLLL